MANSTINSGVLCGEVLKMETITEYIELNLDLMKKVMGFPYILSHKRLEAAVDFVESISRQLSPKDRKKLEEYMDGLH